MKIALLANDTTYTYNLRREIIKRFIEDGNKVYIVAQEKFFTEELEKIGCKVISINLKRHGKNPLQDLSLLVNYIKILKKMMPDVAISFNIKPNIYGGIACSKLKIPFYPNITGLGTPVETKNQIQKLAIFLYKRGVANAKVVFFQNSANLLFFKKHKILSSNSKAILLPGSGVNLKSYPLQRYPENGKIHFLFVARVMKEKGIDYYLAAARKVMSKRNDCVFDICGACDDKKYIKILREAQEQGIVEYHGQQKDMKSWYAKCSCMLFPSYYPEGMSNVLLEAAASGRPLIVANRPGCKEIVDDSKSGYIVPVKDEKAVIEAVNRFLELSISERRRMGELARNKVVSEFNRDIVVNEYEKQVECEK